MRIVWFVTLAASVVGSGPVRAEEDEQPVIHLSIRVVAAWEKAGAETGWLAPPDQFGKQGFRFGGDGKAGDLPAFVFLDWKPGVVGRLPQPEWGFGLGIGGARLTAAGLEELAGLNTLQWLTLANTPVSDFA